MALVLANVIAVTHGLLVTIIVLGAVLAVFGWLRHRPRLEAAYYVLLTAMVVSHFLWGECFLTRWEQTLRNIARPGSAYTDSFIAHYLRFIRPQTSAAIAAGLTVLAVLAFPFWRTMDRRSARPAAGAVANETLSRGHR